MNSKDMKEHLIIHIEKLKNKNMQLTIEEELIYKSLLVQHYGIQNKLYKIIMTWSFAMDNFNKGMYDDIFESLQSDHIFFLEVISNLDKCTENTKNCLFEDFIEIYKKWLTYMINHKAFKTFENIEYNIDTKLLENSIIEYQNDLEILFIA